MNTPYLQNVFGIFCFFKQSTKKSLSRLSRTVNYKLILYLPYLFYIFNTKSPLNIYLFTYIPSISIYLSQFCIKHYHKQCYQI